MSRVQVRNFVCMLRPPLRLVIQYSIHYVSMLVSKIGLKGVGFQLGFGWELGIAIKPIHVIATAAY